MLDTPERTAGQSWREYLSPFKLTLLAINWISFCGSIALLALGQAKVSLVILLVGSGIYCVAGLAGVIIAVRKGPQGGDSR